MYNAVWYCCTVLDDEFIYMFEIEKVPFLPVVGTSRSLIFNQSVELFYIRELGVFTPFEAIFWRKFVVTVWQLTNPILSLYVQKSIRVLGVPWLPHLCTATAVKRLTNFIASKNSLPTCMFSQTMEGPAQRGKIGKSENFDAPEFQSNCRMIDRRS